HLPALADLRHAADDVVDGYEHVAPPGGAVLEHHERGQMPPPDLDPRQARRHQRQGDADLLARAEEAIGIVELEREPDDGRDRAERDVALVPVEADAEHLAALPEATAHDAGIGHRGGIRARLRAGEPEAGNLLALGE